MLFATALLVATLVATGGNASRTVHIRRIAVVVATIGTLVVLVGPAQASSSKPAGMSKAEYRH